jgi:hypothetical protein
VVKISSFWGTAELIMIDSLVDSHKQSAFEEVEEAEEHEPGSQKKTMRVSS